MVGLIVEQALLQEDDSFLYSLKLLPDGVAANDLVELLLRSTGTATAMMMSETGL